MSTGCDTNTTTPIQTQSHQQRMKKRQQLKGWKPQKRGLHIEDKPKRKVKRPTYLHDFV